MYTVAAIEVFARGAVDCRCEVLVAAFAALVHHLACSAICGSGVDWLLIGM